MIALSGVRSSWLMFARKADLCSLAACSSWKSRAPPMATTAWSANVLRTSICASVNAPGVARCTAMTPIGSPSRSIGAATKPRTPTRREIVVSA